MKITRFILDMDEVLADFVGAACKAWGFQRSEVETHWELGNWEMVTALSKALGRTEPMSQREFWTRLNTFDFWNNIPVHPWAMELVELARSYVGAAEVHIVTSPSSCETSYAGKVSWLKRMFGPEFNNFAIIPHKHIFAQKGVVLIDDRETNCQYFQNRPTDGKPTGGSIVVFPYYGNFNHQFRNDPIAHVRRQLNYIEIG